MNKDSKKNKLKNLKLGSMPFTAPNPSASNTQIPGLPLIETVTSFGYSGLAFDLSGEVPNGAVYAGIYNMYSLNINKPHFRFCVFYDASGNILHEAEISF